MKLEAQLLILAALICCFLAVHGSRNKKLYPNLVCHPGYLRKSGNYYWEGNGAAGIEVAGGEYTIKISHDKCEVKLKKERDDICHKACVMEEMQIVPQVSEDVKNFGMQFFKDPESIQKFVEKIRTCKGKYEEVKGKPCDDWESFFTCLDEVMDCP